MPSKCQTLSEYIKRRQQAQNLKLAKFDTSSSIETDKEVTELVSTKKEKVHLILSEILNQVKKSDQTKNRLSMIQAMISNAQRQINSQFQHVCIEVHDKLKQKQHLDDSKQDQRSQSSIDKRLKDKETKKETSNVLREVRTENHMFDVKLERQRIRQKNDLIVKKKKQVKGEGSLKENQVKESDKMRNPEDDYNEKSLFYTFNGLRNDRKQNLKSVKDTKLGQINTNASIS